MQWRRGRPTRRFGPGLALAALALGAALITLPSTHSSAAGPTGPTNPPANGPADSPVKRASARALRAAPGRVGSNRAGTPGPRSHPTGGRTADGQDLDRWRPGRRDGDEAPTSLASPAEPSPAEPSPAVASPTEPPGTDPPLAERPGAERSITERSITDLPLTDLPGADRSPAAPVTADWTPTTPLPAAETRGRRVVVVLSPHPDDETLSFGTWIANAAARGDRVVLVSLTDGRSTGAVGTLSTRLGRPVTRDEIARARTEELRQAATLLGIAPDDVYRAALDGDRTPGGTRITVGEAAAVVDAFVERFPEAVFATMSWVAEHHPDHVNAGRALYEAATRGEVRRATFAVSRLWWSLPAPTAADVLPASAGVRDQVLAAAAAYEVWDPAHQRYAVGRLSVNGQFAALRADPRSRLHGAPHSPVPLTAP